MPALSPVSCRHHPSSLLLFVPGCPGQPGSFLAAVSAVGQELSWFSLLSPEKDGDTQSPAGEDQQVRQPPIPFHLPRELPGGWRRWEPQIPPCPLAAPLPAHCLHPSCWAAGSPEHHCGSPVPHSCQTEAGDLLAHRACGGGRTCSGLPTASPALTAAALCPRPAPRGAWRRRTRRARWRRATCLRCLYSLPTQLSEVRRAPVSGTGLGAGITCCPAGATLLSAALHPVPCASSAGGAGNQGWGLPACSRVMPPDHVLMDFSKAQ